MFQVCIIFFSEFLDKFFAKIISIYFLFFFYNTKNKEFECPKSIRNYENTNAWNIRCLVDESFLPSTQGPSISYWRLSDFLFLGCAQPHMPLIFIIVCLLSPILSSHLFLWHYWDWKSFWSCFDTQFSIFKKPVTATKDALSLSSKSM